MLFQRGFLVSYRPSSLGAIPATTRLSVRLKRRRDIRPGTAEPPPEDPGVRGGCPAQCLKWVKPVTKSANAGSGQRLDPDAHYESLNVDPIMSPVEGLISFDGTNLQRLPVMLSST